MLPRTSAIHVLRSVDGSSMGSCEVQAMCVRYLNESFDLERPIRHMSSASTRSAMASSRSAALKRWSLPVLFTKTTFTATEP